MAVHDNDLLVLALKVLLGIDCIVLVADAQQERVCVSLELAYSLDHARLIIVIIPLLYALYFHRMLRLDLVVLIFINQL